MTFELEYDIEDYLKENSDLLDDEYKTKITWALRKCPNKFKQRIESQLLEFIDEAIYEAIEELYYTEVEKQGGGF